MFEFTGSYILWFVCTISWLNQHPFDVMVHHFWICVAEKKTEHSKKPALFVERPHLNMFWKKKLTQIPCAHTYICDYHLFQIQFDYLGLSGIQRYDFLHVCVHNDKKQQRHRQRQISTNNRAWFNESPSKSNGNALPVAQQRPNQHSQSDSKKLFFLLSFARWLLNTKKYIIEILLVGDLFFLCISICHSLMHAIDVFFLIDRCWCFFLVSFLAF